MQLGWQKLNERKIMYVKWLLLAPRVTGRGSRSTPADGDHRLQTIATLLTPALVTLAVKFSTQRRGVIRGLKKKAKGIKAQNRGVSKKNDML